MPFQKGHKLATGRPAGSLNKETAEAKKILSTIIFNPQHIVDDFNNLDVKGRMEFRCRMAKFVIPEQKAVENENISQTQRLSLTELQNVLNTDEKELPQHS